LIAGTAWTPEKFTCAWCENFPERSYKSTDRTTKQCRHSIQGFSDGHDSGHSNVKTTELYDRRGDEVSFSEIERVGI
jgi:hypothetical protein